MSPDDKLSAHFTIGELVFSSAGFADAKIREAQLNPPGDVLVNLRSLAALLEAVRAIMDIPMRVTSGYRSPDLNRKVGGVSDSAHTLGYACDVQFPALQSGGQQLFSFWERCKVWPKKDSSQLGWLFGALASGAWNLQYDQIIHEFGHPGAPDWVHISADPRLRRQILVATHGASGTQYDRLTPRQALLLACEPKQG